MDYAGIDTRNLRFAVNRPLTAAEEDQRLDVSASLDLPRAGGSLVPGEGLQCLALGHGRTRVRAHVVLPLREPDCPG
ncbi:hypothetical protein G6F46_015488 [Rhizopus delemar]|nr:hypothetical protein G6F46_015488 [Rhizopus delemar]